MSWKSAFSPFSGHMCVLLVCGRMWVIFRVQPSSRNFKRKVNTSAHQSRLSPWWLHKKLLNAQKQVNRFICNRSESSLGMKGVSSQAMQRWGSSLCETDDCIKVKTTQAWKHFIELTQFICKWMLSVFMFLELKRNPLSRSHAPHLCTSRGLLGSNARMSSLCNLTCLSGNTAS